MAENKLFILHQGALGDVVLSFAGLIALRKRFSRIDILCQDQIGRLAVKLELVDRAYPLEAAYFATLFSDTVDTKFKELIRSYTKIIVFSSPGCNITSVASEATASSKCPSVAEKLLFKIPIGC